MIFSKISDEFRHWVDFSKTASDYRLFRAGFPVKFFDALQFRGVGSSGQCILDLGTGTGSLARGLAKSGARVTGLDCAPELLDEARELDKEAGVSITYFLGRAEQTNLPAESFDIVTAGQCWHWFERESVARETLRLLKKSGSIVIAHFDWIPLVNNVAEETEALIVRYNPDWKMGGGTGIYPQWLTDISSAGFVNLETFSFDIMVSYTHEAWRGRIRASAGVKATLSPDQVASFDKDLAALLSSQFPDDPLDILHRCWALLASKP